MKLWIGMGAVLAAIAIALGAFGAHALKARLEPDMLAVFETGARYHMYHALGFFGIALTASRFEHSAIAVSGWLMLAGVAIFSGSLYALSISGVRWLGAITPIGGLCLIFAWLSLAWGVINGEPRTSP